MFTHLWTFATLGQKLKLTSKDNDIIFQFQSPKMKTHKIHIKNALSKDMFLGIFFLKNKQILKLIWIHKNIVQFWPFKNPKLWFG